MNKFPCIYSVVQFLPFVETGEFANVGIVMLAPEHRYFGHRLQIVRHARVTHFFDQLDGRVFREAMRNLKDDLESLRRSMMQLGLDRRLRQVDSQSARNLFFDLICPRESIVRFSEPRAVMTADPKQKLDELFAFYVEKSFANREYGEALLERNVRRWLNQANVGDQFAPRAVGDVTYHVNFPFVQGSDDEARAEKAIKPLNLDQSAPSKILDHGGQWLFRVEQLRKREALPRRVLFAVTAADEGVGARRRAAAEIVGELERIPEVNVIPFNDRLGVVRFAAGK